MIDEMYVDIIDIEWDEDDPDDYYCYTKPTAVYGVLFNFVTSEYDLKEKIIDYLISSFRGHPISFDYRSDQSVECLEDNCDDYELAMFCRGDD